MHLNGKPILKARTANSLDFQCGYAVRCRDYGIELPSNWNAATALIRARLDTLVVQGEDEATNITDLVEALSGSGLDASSMVDYAEHSVKRARV
jgi:hypothetical protein